MADDNDFAPNDDTIYESLPADPEQAFLVLEEHFRKECDALVAASHQDTNTNVFYVNYIAQVLGAITELGLSTKFDDRVPSIQGVDYNTYLDFSKDVRHYRTILKIRHGRRVQGYSVAFDAPTKKKIHHLLTQVREIFTKLEVDEKKRDALFSRLNHLQEEIDRNRTRFDSYAALSIEVAEVAGDMVEKSKILDLLNAVARVFGTAKKEEEQTKKLPPYTPPKQIEDKTPKVAARPASKRGDMDDEIPF